MASLQSERLPLQGIVLCCTSIDLIERDYIHKEATSLGARCLYDLTVDVTHLIVGAVGTPKYAYVAKERPEIKVVIPQFVSNIRYAWKEGETIDIQEYEESCRAGTFYGLRVALTGFKDATERLSLIQKLKDNRAEYHGDLTHRVTHLIAREPSGEKYEHAIKWGLPVVDLKWLEDSVERGMSLDEHLYSFSLPESERGKGAFPRGFKTAVSTEKKTTEPLKPDAPRKLRRAFSQNIMQEQQQIFADLNATVASNARVTLDEWDGDNAAVAAASKPSSRHTAVSSCSEQIIPQASTKKVPVAVDSFTSFANKRSGIFSGAVVYIHGFDKKKTSILKDHLEPRDAYVCSTFEDIGTAPEPFLSTMKFIIAPHNVKWDDLPPLPDSASKFTVVTEWWVERCLAGRKYVDPTCDSFSQFFYMDKVQDFDKVVVCSTGFPGMELLHLSKLVRLLGGTYQQYLNSSATVLISKTEEPNKDKVRYARDHGIAVVSVEWLWASVGGRKRLPFDDFLITGFQPMSARSLQKLKTLTSDSTKSSIEQRILPNNPSKAALSNKPTLKDQEKANHSGHPPKRRLPFEDTATTDSPSPPAKRRSASPLGSTSPSKLNALRPSPPPKADRAPSGAHSDSCNPQINSKSAETSITPISTPEPAPAAGHDIRALSASAQQPRGLPPEPSPNPKKSVMKQEFANLLAAARAKRTASDASNVGAEDPGSAHSGTGNGGPGTGEERAGSLGGMPRKRRKGALGRAVSGTSFDVPGLGSGEAQDEKAQRDEGLGLRHEMQASQGVASQKIVYEDDKMRETRLKAIEKLGGKVTVAENVRKASGVGVVRDKPAEPGVGRGRRRGRKAKGGI